MKMFKLRRRKERLALQEEKEVREATISKRHSLSQSSENLFTSGPVHLEFQAISATSHIAIYTTLKTFYIHSGTRLRLRRRVYRRRERLVTSRYNFRMVIIEI